MQSLYDKYRLLEVDRTASVEEVKRSYKRLCLKYHPDKNSGNTDRFIELQRAYEDVMRERETNINFFIMFYYFINVFGKSQCISINLTVPLEDIYANKIKKLMYTRIGRDLQRTQETVFLELCGWKQEYRLEGFGDYNIITKGFEELVITVKVSNNNFNHLVLNKIVNLYDINTSIDINLYEYYYGVKRVLRYFDEDIELDYNPYKDGKTQVLYGKGLMDDNHERYNLYVFYNVDFTRNRVDETSRELIKNVFNI
jgi:DnaJ-class molecular chaperone